MSVLGYFKILEFSPLLSHSTLAPFHLQNVFSVFLAAEWLENFMIAYART